MQMNFDSKELKKLSLYRLQKHLEEADGECGMYQSWAYDLERKIKANPRLKKAKEELEEAEYHLEYWEHKWHEISDLMRAKRKQMYQDRKIN